MQLVGRQAAQGLGHVGIGDLHGLFQGLALGHGRDHAGNRDGGAAAEGLELDVLDAVVRHLDIDVHHVAAHRVADFADAVGIQDFADIAGILEMIHNYLGIHDCSFTK